VTLFEIILLTVSGVLVGFINTLAGGGSIISLSVLMMLGLPAPLANGTNRIAIFLQTLTAIGTFTQKKVMDFRKGMALAVPTVVGSVVGAWIAVDINEKAFEYAVGVIMLFMLFFILYKPEKWIRERKELTEKKVSLLQIVIFFLIGVYGGFIQLGAGYFFLAGIVLGAGYELVKANAIKGLIIFLYTPFAMLVFIFNDQVDWLYGTVIAIGNIAGAIIASKMAVEKGAKFVRWVIIIVILLTSASMFGLIDFKEMVQIFSN
jgi:uncharacterized membrane protein YfcA